jgi:hypothetical protein
MGKGEIDKEKPAEKEADVFRKTTRTLQMPSLPFEEQEALS